MLTSRWAWVVGLVASVMLLGGPALALGQNAEALQKRFIKAMEQGQWKQAIEAGEKLADAQPSGGAVSYNVACCYAKLGDTKTAADWLVRSAGEGWAGLSSIESDPDLQGVRGEPAYAKALELVKANRDKRFDAFKQKAEATEPLVVLPPNYDKETPCPLIVALHGSGGTGREMARIWKDVAAKAGAVLVCPDALRPLGDGYQWTFRDEAEWMVLRTIERMSATHRIDPARIVITGFSQGANVCFDVGIKHSAKFCGVIPVAGHWEPDVSPLPGKAPAGAARFYMMVGSNDQGTQSYRDAEREFAKVGFEREVKIYEGLGHSFPPNSQRELATALAYALRADEKPAPRR